MKLGDSVAAAVAGVPDEPAATLALEYARRIDNATHTRASTDKALRILRVEISRLDDSDKAESALATIAATVSALTVLSDLGPKLLATLDALLLTPKATKALTQAVTDAARPPSPLDKLRDRHDSRRLRAAN